MQPNTVGLAFFDNPLGQLAWIAEKFVECMCHEDMTHLFNTEMGYRV